ncbi:MAG: glycoside hydrolase family 28 protein [Microbacterium gubbeenense]|uniref:glycoside hydrolase family 28 protein n=3 Tax=Microbacterium gubbeenense TaxID=159896 RepID=UPI003F9B8607
MSAISGASSSAEAMSVSGPRNAMNSGPASVRRASSMIMRAPGLSTGSSSLGSAPARIHQPCIFADGETNVSVTGLGTIDGGGSFWWDKVRRGESLEAARPTLISFRHSTRVTIRDVVLENSPAWTVHPFRCNDVRVSGVRIKNPADSPNTDGIDPESCRNVRITDCHIDVGDDCIAIKAGTEASSADPAPCENVIIANCTMLHGHGGVVIGSEMSGDVRGIVISDCVFDGTDRGVRLKTRRGRGGVVEDLRITNIVMRRVACPFVFNPFYFCGPEGKLPRVSDRSVLEVDETTPTIRRVFISNVSASEVSSCAGFISGLPERPLDDITIVDVSISFAADPVPSVPAMADGVPEMAAAGFHIDFVRNSRLSGVSLTGLSGDAITAGANVTNLTAEVTTHDH